MNSPFSIIDWVEQNAINNSLLLTGMEQSCVAGAAIENSIAAVVGAKYQNIGLRRVCKLQIR